MPEEEVSSGPQIIIEPEPMGMAKTPPVDVPEASTARGGFLQKIRNIFRHTKAGSPEPPQAASAQPSMPTEIPSAPPSQAEAPQPPAPPTTGTPTT